MRRLVPATAYYFPKDTYLATPCPSFVKLASNTSQRSGNLHFWERAPRGCVDTRVPAQATLAKTYLNAKCSLGHINHNSQSNWPMCNLYTNLDVAVQVGHARLPSFSQNHRYEAASETLNTYRNPTNQDTWIHFGRQKDAVPCIDPEKQRPRGRAHRIDNGSVATTFAKSSRMPLTASKYVKAKISTGARAFHAYSARRTIEISSLGAVDELEASESLIGCSAVLCEETDMHEPRPKPINWSEWAGLAVYAKEHYGSQAVWDCLELLRDTELITLSEPGAFALRTELLNAAVERDQWLEELVKTVNLLDERHGFEWPDVYLQAMFTFLNESAFERVYKWHPLLYALFKPSRTAFTSLLTRFCTIPGIPMYSTLMWMYHEPEAEHHMYDDIVPQLFRAGHFDAANRWRKKFLNANDLPRSTDARRFLHFLRLYYPYAKLDPAEEAVLNSNNSIYEAGASRPPVTDKTAASSSQEALISRWFASTWTSVDFAIQLVHRLGVRSIGPRALQALAMRNPNSHTIQASLTQLKAAGVTVEPTMYYHLLQAFVEREDEILLKDFLTCDVHPDEFEDIGTIRMLAVAALRRHDEKQLRLMRAIVKAIQSTVSKTNPPKVSKYSDVLPMIEDISPLPREDQIQLRLKITEAFQRINDEPRNRKLEGRHGNVNQALMDVAQPTQMLVEAFESRVAVPIHFWRKLLTNLGKLGLFKEMEHLCVKIVELYKPAAGGLLPVWHEDLPVPKPMAGLVAKQGNKDAESQRSNHRSLWNGDDGLEQHEFGHHNKFTKRVARGESNIAVEDLNGCIPAELSFSHRQHPVQKLFDPKLQRSIVRWWFDSVAKRGPSELHYVPEAQLGGVADGIKLLARLRDEGVLINQDVIKSALVARIVTAGIPGRSGRGHDGHERSAVFLQRLVEDAWGPGMFAGRTELLVSVQKRKESLLSGFTRSRNDVFEVAEPTDKLSGLF